MAVLRSKRSLAYSEFERNMEIIHSDLEHRMHGLPVRYKKHLCEPLYARMNAALDALIIADEQTGSTAAARQKREKCFRQAVENIMGMERPLMAMLNIRETREASCKMIGDSLNYELALIWGAAKWEEERPLFHSLKKEKFSKLAFLGNMSKLHKYTFQKTAHAPGNCFDSLSRRLDDFATNALFDVVVANDKAPTTRAEAEKRDELLKDAIDNLNAMQRPMVGLWNIVEYSEETMDEWSGMLDEELKILTGLRNKDRERFRSLK